MSYLDGFFQMALQVWSQGARIAPRRILNFSADFTVSDDPTTGVVSVGLAEAPDDGAPELQDERFTTGPVSVQNGSRRVLVGAEATTRQVTLASAPGASARVTVGCSENTGTEPIEIFANGFEPNTGTSFLIGIGESVTMSFAQDLNLYVVEGKFTP